jgi:hypothetical protein
MQPTESWLYLGYNGENVKLRKYIFKLLFGLLSLHLEYNEPNAL